MSFGHVLVRSARRQTLRKMAQGFGKRLRGTAGPVMVIAPHPDDETLGCGGMLAEAEARGVEVQVVTLSDGGGAHRGHCATPEEQVGAGRRALAVRAGVALGVPAERMVFLGLKDGEIPEPGDAAFDWAVERVRAELEKVQPRSVFCPHPLEGWSDHEATEAITRDAMRRWGGGAELFHYCVWFWFSMPLRRAWRCDWKSARTLDISEVYERKRQAMDIYLNTLAPCGASWVGLLPGQFVKAFEWKRELFFRAAE